MSLMSRRERAIRNTRLCQLQPVIVRVMLAMALAGYIARILAMTTGALQILLGTTSKSTYRSLRLAEEAGMVKEWCGLYSLTPKAVDAIKEVFLLLKVEAQ